jgi:Mg2+ and Co2+ transporter CorA
MYGAYRCNKTNRQSEAARQLYRETIVHYLEMYNKLLFLEGLLSILGSYKSNLMYKEVNEMIRKEAYDLFTTVA